VKSYVNYIKEIISGESKKVTLSEDLLYKRIMYKNVKQQ